MKKNRGFIRILTLALLASLSVFFTLSFDTGKAEAQERRTFLEILFGRKTLKTAQPSLSTRLRNAHQNAYKQAGALPADIIRKNKNAKRILVVGDFVASAMAEGLTRAYNNNPDIVVIIKTEGASGFVRSDYYNWPARINDIITREKPDVILIMLGANDRQTIKLANKNLDVLTPEWTSNYRNHIISFTEALRKSGSFWIWLSLPSFKQPNLNQSIVEFNACFKQETEKAGGYFVDIWGGFVDENGNFALSGYDINGQTARLRANDGINFTPSGRRKLAFYAEQAIQALSGNMLRINSPSAEPDFPEQYPNIQRIAPTGIWGSRNQNLDLAGASFTIPSGKALQNQNNNSIQDGYHSGRADDFKMPE